MFHQVVQTENNQSKHFLGRMHQAIRSCAVILPLLILTNCFQVTQILDWKDDDSMDVRWLFRFSKALEQAQSGQAQDKKNTENLSAQVDKAKNEIPAKLKNLVKNLDVKKIDTEFDSGIELSFMIPDYVKFPFNKLQKEDFPMIPQYIPSKKQVIFHFEPMKKPEDKKKESSGKEAKDRGSDKKEGAQSEQPDSGDQFAAMGKQITQLFLSSVRYQIFLGKRFNPEKIYLKKATDEKVIEIQRILDIVTIDIPLFAMFGEKEEPFQVIIQMK
jgi:hypothetical protein